MAVVLTAIIVYGTAVLIWLFVLQRSIGAVQRALADRSADAAQMSRRSLPDNRSLHSTPEPVPRQILHDLNNLLSTMGGFAEAALEDLDRSDPIRADLAEISDAAERAKGVVKRLSNYAPANSESDSAPPTLARSITSSYELPSKRPHQRVSASPPPVRPVATYRESSRPPMVTPVPSKPASSPPLRFMAEARPASGDDIRRTAAFPMPRISTNTGDAHRAADRAPLFQRDDPQALPATAATSAPPTGRRRLLIVDDEVQLLTMFRRVFEPQGFHVTTFSDSLEAWDAFRQDSSQYDLAILDQRMPEMSGSSLATEMISLRPDFPIILLTGYSDTVSPDDAARIGIRKYLSKPIPQAKLSATIRSLLDEATA